MLSCGMVCVLETAEPSWWQLPQVCGMFIVDTGERGSLGLTTLWVP